MRGQDVMGGQAAGRGGAGRAAGRAGAGRAVRLTPGEVSSFCEGMAAMLAAGIQVDEALALLGESGGATELGPACDELYERVAEGESLAGAMRACGLFPERAVSMVAVGERAGRTERTLRALTAYYDEEARVMAKVRTAVGYPAALLCVMSVVLLFTVVVILPVFLGVYEDMTGSLTAGSSLAVSVALGIGWVALAVTLTATAVMLAALVASRTVGGQEALVRLMGRLAPTREAMRQIGLSRFMAAVATGLSAGSGADAAMGEALGAVDDEELRERLAPAVAAVADVERGAGIARALAECGVLEPTYARMLAIGSRVGSVDRVLERLAETFFDDAVDDIDRAIDAVEPALAAFLTLAVGATLVAVMLPLIGIMGAVG